MNSEDDFDLDDNEDRTRVIALEVGKLYDVWLENEFKQEDEEDYIEFTFKVVEKVLNEKGDAVYLAYKTLDGCAAVGEHTAYWFDKFGNSIHDHAKFETDGDEYGEDVKNWKPVKDF